MSNNKDQNGHEMGSLSHNEYEKFNELYNLLKAVECFEYEGIIFNGNMVEVVKRYIKLNPSDKFFVWIQDNVKILKDTKNLCDDV